MRPHLGGAPLNKTSHYVAGVNVAPQSRKPEAGATFEHFYDALGFSMLPTVCGGDCAFDCMLMMLALPSGPVQRCQLREELSDYLLERLDQRWMLELLALCQEIDMAELRLCMDGILYSCAGVAPAPPAVAEEAAGVAVALEEPEDGAPDPIDVEAVAALRWATGIEREANLLALCRSLPPQSQLTFNRLKARDLGEELLTLRLPRAEL